MSETAKRAILIVVAVVALIAAGYSAYQYMNADKPIPSGVDNSLPAGSKTGKQLEMEAMQRGAAGGERDASGAPPKR